MRKIAEITGGLVIITALAVIAILLIRPIGGNADVGVSTVSVSVDDNHSVGNSVPVLTGTDNLSTDKEEVKNEEVVYVSRNTIVNLDDLVAPETTEAEVRSVEELADYVLNEGLDGSDREAYLGDRYDEVQDFIDSEYQQPIAEDSYYEPVYNDYSADRLNPEDGINYYYGVLETYYDLPMDGLVQMLYDMGYEGTYWVREDGVKMWDEYVIVAADFDYEPRGTITETSLGTGIVLDTGEGGWGWHDIAVEGW